jgi:ATP-dependent Clp protease ATP-binding subunit ClpC
VAWKRDGRRASGDMFERFTDRARRVVVLAQEEARMLGHTHIGTEHLLLGLIHEGKGVAARALDSLDISLGAVRQQVEEVIGRGQEAPSSGHIPFTPRAKKVLELSLREAQQLGDQYIGTEHVLLGLIREGEGVAAQVLVGLGADLNRVRGRVIELLHGFAAEAVTGIGSVVARLSAVEQRVGIAPGTGDLDQQADLPSLAEKVRQLSEEVERLRGLLREQGREQGREPEQGTA